MIVQLESVIYGSIIDNCIMNETKAKQIVEKKCKRSTCTSIQSSSYFFNNTNPCSGKTVQYKNKVLNITYSCGQGK